MTEPVQTKENIVRAIRAHRDRIRAFGIRKIGLFGSFVREKQNAESDVDLLVEFEPEQKTFDNFMDLCFFLDDLFNRRVELLTTESLSPYIGPRILKEVEYVAFDS
ncbi:MAG: nucleotidyltransferase family protein [Deltaproteobacteria bacterium]|nr:nucleotidyltransferase family protein [Deltaproteobacteria bacterium]